MKSPFSVPGVEFFDVEGIPVSLGNFCGSYSLAWDRVPPRPFPPDSARRNGAPVSPEAFAKLLPKGARDWAEANAGS